MFGGGGIDWSKHETSLLWNVFVEVYVSGMTLQVLIYQLKLLRGKLHDLYNVAPHGEVRYPHLNDCLQVSRGQFGGG